MQKIIIKTGRTYPALAAQLGDFEDWITRELGVNPATGAWWMCSRAKPCRQSVNALARY
jgi:hypothetical protein